MKEDEGVQEKEEAEEVRSMEVERKEAEEVRSIEVEKEEQAKEDSASDEDSDEAEKLEKKLRKLKREKRIIQLKQEIAELKKSVESNSKSKRRRDVNDASTPPAKKRKEKLSFVSMVLDKEKHVEFPQNSHVVPNCPKSGSIFPPNTLMIMSIVGNRAEVIYQSESDDNEKRQITGLLYFSYLEQAMNGYKEGSLIGLESVLIDVETNKFSTDPAIVAAAKGNGPGILPKDFSQISKGTVVTGIQGIKGFVNFLDHMKGRIPKAQSTDVDYNMAISCEVVDFNADAKKMILMPLRCKLPIVHKVGDVVDGIVVGKHFNTLAIHIMSDENDTDMTVNGRIFVTDANPSQIDGEPNPPYDNKILPHHPFSDENGIKVGEILKKLTVIRINKDNHIVDLTNKKSYIPVDEVEKGDVVSCFINYVMKKGLCVEINPKTYGHIWKDENEKEFGFDDLEKHYAPGMICKALVTGVSFKMGRTVAKLSIRELPK